MVKLNIKKFLGLKSLNAITNKELKSELDKFDKKEFIDFLTEIPKENISFLFEESKEEENEETEDII